MLSDADGAKSERVMKALLQMKKFDLQALERAYTGLAAATSEAMSVGDVASLTRQE